MAMTLTEKILAAKVGASSLKPGDFIQIEPDLGLANDITAPIAIDEFRKAGGKKVKFPERVFLVPDHFTPNKDILSAEQVKILRDFGREHAGVRFFEQGVVGVEHALLPEMGAIVPGMAIIGADSHTCTYGALGAFATGVGSTDLAGFYLTGKAWLRVPQSIKVMFKGSPTKWLTGKDLILLLIGKISVSGATYRALEISGPVIDGLTVEGRLTMANRISQRQDEREMGSARSRCRRGLRIDRRDRRDGQGTAGRAPPPPREREGSCRMLEDHGGPGRHRFVHERTDRRSPAGGRRAQGKKGGTDRTLHRDPGDTENLPSGDG
jgi:hypothetical protein